MSETMMQTLNEESNEVSKFLNVYDLFGELENFSPHLNVSIIISGKQRDKTIPLDTYTQFSIFDISNGPALVVFKSSFVPNVSVEVLKDCLNLLDKDKFKQKIRLLRGEDGFKLNLNNVADNINFTLTGHQRVGGQVEQNIFDRYGLLKVIGGGTFVSLVFREDG